MERPPDLVESTHKSKVIYTEKIPETLSASNIDGDTCFNDEATGDNVGARGDQQNLLSNSVPNNIGKANGDQVFHQNGPKTPDETYPKFVQLTPDKECSDANFASTPLEEEITDKNPTWYQGSETSSLAEEDEDKSSDDSKYDGPVKQMNDLPERPLKG